MPLLGFDSLLNEIPHLHPPSDEHRDFVCRTLAGDTALLDLDDSSDFGGDVGSADEGGLQLTDVKGRPSTVAKVSVTTNPLAVQPILSGGMEAEDRPLKPDAEPEPEKTRPSARGSSSARSVVAAFKRTSSLKVEPPTAQVGGV